jgi:hypothetical protein
MSGVIPTRFSDIGMHEATTFFVWGFDAT